MSMTMVESSGVGTGYDPASPHSRLMTLEPHAERRREMAANAFDTVMVKRRDGYGNGCVTLAVSASRQSTVAQAQRESSSTAVSILHRSMGSMRIGRCSIERTRLCETRDCMCEE